MKNNKLLLLVVGVFLILYLDSEILFRFDVLNQGSFGVFGWLYLVCLCVIVFLLLVLPFISSVRFPKWEDPDSIDDLGRRRIVVRNYAEKLLLHGERSGKLKDYEVLKRLRTAALNAVRDDETYNELESATIAAHEWFAGALCDEVITRNMKRAGLVIAISQRGIFDGLAMLYMQVKMIGEIADIMGYQKSWILQTKCSFWLMSNSLVFALLGDEALDDAMADLIGVTAGEKLAGNIPFVGRILSSVVQGAAAMATVYATGRMVQHYFAGQRKLTGRERIALRIEGFKKSATLQVVA